MDERMTICNMSIEGGARVGYVNPDETTFAYLKGRPFAPAGAAFETACEWWRSMASDADAVYDDDVEIRAEELTPVVTWGVNPGQSIGVDGLVPSPQTAAGRHRQRRARLHAPACRPADRRHQGRRRVHRFVHQRPPLRPARGRAHRPRSSRRAACDGAGGAGLGVGAPRRRAGGARRGLSRRRLRMAWRRLLDVSGDEPGQARRRSAVRLLVESQLQGAAGESDRAHAADEPGDGGGRGAGRRGHRRAHLSSRCRRQEWPDARVCDRHDRGRESAADGSVANRAGGGDGAADARRRHRHRPDPPGALPARGDVRRPGTAGLHRRPGGGAQGRHRPSRSTTRSTRARRSCSSTATSAAARRASMRRRGCAAGASAPSSANRSPRSSSATRCSSGCRASRRRPPTSAR